MKNFEKEISSENADLMNHLKEMEERRNKQYSKTKGRANALLSTKFCPRSKIYKPVTSRLDYETAKEKELYKREQYSELKEQLDLRECTFKPNVDLHSMTLTQKNPRTPIEQREVPSKYKRKDLDERESLRKKELREKELQTMRLPDNQGKKPTREFYDQKVEWKKNHKEKMEKRRLDQLSQETNSFIGKPQLFQGKMSQMVAEKLASEPFLQRVNKHIDNKKELRSTLEKKYYDHSFKPALYKPRRTGEVQITH
jgi:hypothetical protein